MQGSFKLYYWNDEPNMGDMFNVDLCKKLMGITPTAVEPSICEAAFCGSLLDDFLYRKVFPIRMKEYESEVSVQIWGAGFIDNKWNCATKIRKILPETFKRKVDIHAVRGRLSKNRLTKITRISLDNVVLADPGLLASEFIDGVIEKKYDFGVIPHHCEWELPVYNQFHKDNILMIDVRQDPVKCIELIAQCKYILSSSLHGMIFADSLGIPNARIVASNKVLGGNYKYKDYYSSFCDRHMISVDIRKGQTVDIENIFRYYESSVQEIEKKKEELMKSFPYGNGKGKKNGSYSAKKGGDFSWVY